jgi:predicted DNA-binding protein with PD1-like motif
LGGADQGSKLIVGPEQARAKPIVPRTHILEFVNEVAGTGTLFPDEDGKPELHMHLACGERLSTKTGCVRKGVIVWHIMEVVLFELIDSTAVRVYDDEIKFKLLEP